MSPAIELPRVQGPGSGLDRPWKVIVRNDNHNTFEHVAATLARVLPAITYAQGHEFARLIDGTGKAVVWLGHQELAEHYWEALAAAGLTMAPLEQA